MGLLTVLSCEIDLKGCGIVRNSVPEAERHRHLLSQSAVVVVGLLVAGVAVRIVALMLASKATGVPSYSHSSTFISMPGSLGTRGCFRCTPSSRVGIGSGSHSGHSYL